jgi:hypothetical protein
MVDYQNKTFKFISNSEHGEADSNTIFHYHQQGKIVTAEYGGGTVIKGHMLATVEDDGTLNVRYHHVNNKGEIRTGTCVTKPQILDSGKIRLHEKWQWTCGDGKSGESVLEEV